MADEPKSAFGKYVVRDKLGEGGMGRVWSAYDPDLEVVVAIKELKEQYRDQQNLERFYREAQIAAKCRHQNIVLITDLSKIPPYFVMEYLDARELSVFTHKGSPITLGRLVKVLSQVCDGLGFLHARGIYHRDLKPANIMLLKDDTVKVTDFGISKAPFGQATMTQVIMGTIPYMSPEQITTPGKVDGRSDLWALGVILYELTQRRHPFPGEGDINTIFHIVHSQPAPFSKLHPKVEEPMQRFLTKALQKNADDRIRSTEEFKVMLQALMRGVPDPEGIVFPYEEEAGRSMATSLITQEELLKAIVERAFVLVGEIENQSDARRKVLAKGAYEKAGEVARMARVLVEEKNVMGLESVLKDLETQKAALDAGVAEGLKRVRAEAEGHVQAGRHKEAAEAWARILAVETSHVEARAGLEKAKQAQEGLRAVGALVARGRELEGKGDIAGAAAEYKKALQREPGHPEAGALLRDAQKRLELLGELRSYVDQARGALEGRKVPEARFYIKKVLERDPRHKEALELEAEVARLEGTIELLNLMRAEGRRFLEQKDYEHARESWATVLEMSPGDAEAGEALKRLDQAVRELKGRDAALQKSAEAESALREQDYEKAVHLYKEAERLTPGEASIQKGAETARKRLAALRTAEKEAAAAEKSGDLAAAVRTWEQVAALQKTHPRAAQEIGRLSGLIKKEEEKRVAETQKAHAEEDQRQVVARRQQEVSAALEALGGDIGAYREALDERLLGSMRDLVGRVRSVIASHDLKALEAALAEISASRKGVADAVRRATDAAFQPAAALIASIEEIPKDDYEALGASLMSRAVEAAARLKAAHQQGDFKAVRDQSKGLQSLAQEIQSKRDSALAKGAAAVKEAVGALESALRPNEKHLKESTVRSAREAVARAQKDMSGPRLHPLAGHVGLLRGLRDGILKEIQDTLRSLREEIQKGVAALQASAAKNRRAVAKKPDLARKVEVLAKEAAEAPRAESLEALGRLAKELQAALAAVPLDPLRFLPHALAAAGVILAVAGFLGWRWYQGNTEHPYDLRVLPWGHVVSIQKEGGESVAPPPGDSPFHRLKLKPGAYTITVEGRSGARGTATAQIDVQKEGTIKLEGVNYATEIPRYVASDPFFAQGP